MDLNELRASLGVLTLSDLETAGIITKGESAMDGVIIRTTSKKHDRLHNETMFLTSVNRDDVNFIILVNGMLNSAKAAKETNRPAEVGRVYITKEKASMLLDAIKHAFPDVIREELSRPVANDASFYESDIEDDLLEDDLSDELICDDDDDDDDVMEDDFIHDADSSDHCTCDKTVSADDLIDRHLNAKKFFEKLSGNSDVKSTSLSDIDGPNTMAYVVESKDAEPKHVYVGYMDLVDDDPMWSMINKETAKLLLKSISDLANS